MNAEDAEHQVDAVSPATLGRAADLLGLFEVPPQSGEPETAGALSRDSRFRRLLITADSISAAIALFLGVLVISGDQLRPGALLAIPFVVATSKVIGLYDRDELLLHKATLDEAPSLLQLSVLLSLFVWLAEPLMVSGELAKVGFLAIAVATFAAALTLRASARWLASRTTPPERCLFLGPPEASKLLASKLALGGCAGAHLVGRVELEDQNGRAVISGQLAHVVAAQDIDRVILSPTSAGSDAVLDLIREAKALGVKVSLMPRLSEVLGSSVVFDDLHGVTVLAIRQFGLSRSSKALKRWFDVAVAGVCLLVIAPLFAAIALAIKLTSPGPVFYRQTRVGRGGRHFQILKFRTMAEGAHEQRSELAALNEADGGLFKIAADPRVTRVGRFLRRTSLDETPQLLNVLRGEMSLVGPRPLVVDEDASDRGLAPPAARDHARNDRALAGTRLGKDPATRDARDRLPVRGELVAVGRREVPPQDRPVHSRGTRALAAIYRLRTVPFVPGCAACSDL